MPGWKDPRDEMELSAAEKAAQRRLGKAGEAGSLGGLAGTAIGGALGALGFLGGPVVGAATTSAGMGLGQGVGGMIGNALEEGDLEDAQKTLAAGAEKRQRALTDAELREELLDELMNTE